MYGELEFYQVPFFMMTFLLFPVLHDHAEEQSCCVSLTHQGLLSLLRRPIVHQPVPFA